MSLTVLPTKRDRPRVSLWIFVISWLTGNFALIAGFEAAEGFLQSTVALGVLAVASSAWWGGYRLSNFRSRGGFVVIAWWMLGPLVALLEFQHSIRSPFLWGSTTLLLGLLALALYSKAASVRWRVVTRQHFPYSLLAPPYSLLSCLLPTAVASYMCNRLYPPMGGAALEVL